MSAAACAPTRVGMLTFAERMAAPPPTPAAAPPAPMVIDGAGAGAGEGGVNPQLWLACAGSMCTVPPVGAAVFYFPQGHAEQASGAVDLSAVRAPPMVACRVVAVRYMAEPQTDEVFATIRLVPLRPGEPVADVGEAAAGAGGDDHHQQQQPNKPASFAKTLTQSDANNGGGFSVPRFCAETIFPELDYRAEPPVQSVCARDVHGAEWTFRHIYRGTPRRHLLTTGWSNFVNKKKLLAGDSIVFLRGENGGVHVGLRRAKRGFCGGGGDEGPAASALSGWGVDTGYGPLARGNAARSSSAGGRIPPEDVAAAARLAAAGQPFEVVHYPRASTPEFCVRAAAVRAALQVQWCPGTRFKMAFETEDSSRISWFMGTISGAQPADSRWPQSPWRRLQVTWDEPELLHNVKRVCPWLVEQVSSMPNLHLPNFSPPAPPRKKPRIPEFHFEGQPPLFDPAAAFPPAAHPLPHPPHDHRGLVPFLPFPDGSAAAGIQGARHAQLAPFFSDLHLSNLHQTLLLCGVRPPADPHAAAPPAPRISTDLAIGNRPHDAPRSPPPSAAAKNAAADDDDVKAKPPGIMLFGRAILTEEQMEKTTSPGAAAGKGSPKRDRDAEKGPNTPDGAGSSVTEGSPTKNNNLQWPRDNSPPSELFGQEPGQCKVFVESDAVGRNLDLAAVSSYEELCARLSAMFFLIDGGADLRSHVLYRTAAGEVRHLGDEPFSAFVKSARRITIPSDAGGSDSTGSH